MFCVCVCVWGGGQVPGWALNLVQDFLSTRMGKICAGQWYQSISTPVLSEHISSCSVSVTQL